MTNGISTRLVLHSFIGGIILGIPIALFTVWFASRLPIPEQLKRKPEINRKIILSIVIGVLSHNLIDSLMLHGGRAMPLLYPFSQETYAFLIIDGAVSNILWHIVAIILLIYYGRIMLVAKYGH